VAVEERVEVTSPMAATVADLRVAPGDAVAADATVAYVEAMKMEHRVVAPAAGVVLEVHVAVGDLVEPGQALVVLGPDAGADAPGPGDPDEGAAGARGDLERVRERRALLEDEARPDAVARRHAAGHRTVRENVAALVDPGSFSEYGGLAIAAQRGRKGVERLLRETPADGLVTGVATVNADVAAPERARVAVAAYDVTVLAGTQGHVNHLKKDRLFRLAAEQRLPVVLLADGGGGRPGDTDVSGGAWLDVPAFALLARLSGTVPLVAVVTGRCFAGNAALAGCCDVIIATRDANLGMAGPAMIEGGGLGVVSPDDIGPAVRQHEVGVVDVLVDDDVAAVDAASRVLAYLQAPQVTGWEAADQAPLRDAVPEHASASTTCARCSTCSPTPDRCWNCGAASRLGW
jgi:acetyl-CoA carboxylase carboxyltransferase component